MSTSTDNLVAGDGYYSHSVPTAEGVVIHMRDGYHAGTEIYLTTDGAYRFVSLDMPEVHTAPRAILIRCNGISFDEVLEASIASGLDATSDDGLALAGIEEDDDLDWLPEDAEVIWDSAGK